MPSLNFTMFIDQIEDGRKTQTIRALRKHPIKAGDRLHLFTGLRRPGARRLSPLEGVICTGVYSLIMTRWSDRIVCDGIPRGETIESVATRDGFDHLVSFSDFFVPNNGDIFTGQLIRWKHWSEPVDARDPRIWLPRQEAGK